MSTFNKCGRVAPIPSSKLILAAVDVWLYSMKRVASPFGKGAMALAFVHEYFKNLSSDFTSATGEGS